jgi:hypothetical protein
MICVCIANESRRMAMADMLTAAHQGDTQAAPIRFTQ